ncbi:MAG: hypothetical protein SNH94_06075 [Rikenellaceae bacterium]
MKILRYFALFAFMSTLIVSCEDASVDLDDDVTEDGTGGNTGGDQDDDDDDNSQGDTNDENAQTIDVVAYEQYSISFASESAWSASADVSWITFKNEEIGTFAKTLSGQAGSDLSITVLVGDDNMDFGDDQGKITLTVSSGDQEVIAILTREGNEPEITFSIQNYETYEYDALDIDQVLSIDWNDMSTSYLEKITFSANFPWRIEGIPDWIENNISDPIQTEGSASDVFEDFLKTSYADYLDTEKMEATINIVCQTNSDISYSLNIETPGAKGFMHLIRSDTYDGFYFDADATFYSYVQAQRWSYYEFVCVVESNPSLAEPVAIICQADGTLSEQSEIADWVNITPSQSYSYDDSDSITGYSDIEDTTYDYLTQFIRWISVDENEESEDRAAAIFVFPSSVTYDSIADLYDDAGAIKEEYTPYLIDYLYQEGSITEVLLDFYGVAYNTVDAEITQYDPTGTAAKYIAEDYGVPTDAIFKVNFAGTGGALFKFPLGTSNSTGYTVDPSSSDWLSCESTDEYFTISMTYASSTTTGSKTGYILLKNSDGDNAVYINCTQVTQ